MRAYDPEIWPEIVPSVYPIWMVVSPCKATLPDRVPAEPKKTAPPEAGPVPEIWRGSGTFTAASISRLAPDETVVP